MLNKREILLLMHALCTLYTLLHAHLLTKQSHSNFVSVQLRYTNTAITGIQVTSDILICNRSGE